VFILGSPESEPISGGCKRELGSIPYGVAICFSQERIGCKTAGQGVKEKCLRIHIPGAYSKFRNPYPSPPVVYTLSPHLPHPHLAVDQDAARPPVSPAGQIHSKSNKQIQIPTKHQEDECTQ
jgi:hypothetical protein